MNNRKIDHINFFQKSVILRTDYNVPISNTKITSTIRIDASLQTIQFILNQQPTKIIIISHRGRPNSPNDNDLSLILVRNYLEQKLNMKIYFTNLSDYLTIDPTLISEKIILSGTNSPLAIIFSTCFPNSVLRLTESLSISPVEI